MKPLCRLFLLAFGLLLAQPGSGHALGNRGFEHTARHFVQHTDFPAQLRRFLADVANLAGTEAEAVLEWIENGGMLLRFAGPRLAASDQGLG